MTSEMEQIKKDIHEIKLSNAEIHNVLVGSKLSNDGGLIRRVANSEIKIEKIEIEVDAIKKSEIKNNVYLKLLWWVSGIVTSATIIYLFNKIFK